MVGIMVVSLSGKFNNIPTTFANIYTYFMLTNAKQGGAKKRYNTQKEALGRLLLGGCPVGLEPTTFRTTICILCLCKSLS